MSATYDTTCSGVVSALQRAWLARSAQRPVDSRLAKFFGRSQWRVFFGESQSCCGLSLAASCMWCPTGLGVLSLRVKLFGGWRCIQVSSQWLVALCRQLLFSDCFGLGLWLLDLSSVVKLLGGWCVIGLVSSSWLVALCKQLLCPVIVCCLGSGCGAQTRSSSCLAAGVKLRWCHPAGWWHCAVCWYDLWLRVSWALYAEFKLGRQAAWRPRCNRSGVVKTVGGTVHSAAEL